MVQEGNLIAEIGQQKMETFRFFLDTPVNLTTNVPDLLNLKIYPNPLSSGVLNIEIPSLESDALLKVYNSKGQLILNKELKTKKNKLILNDYPAGVYLFSIEAKGKKITKKVLIVK